MTKNFSKNNETFKKNDEVFFPKTTKGKNKMKNQDIFIYSVMYNAQYIKIIMTLETKKHITKDRL